MISERTTDEVVEQIQRWQRKHKLQNGQIEELLRWISKAKGSKSFSDSISRINVIYWDACEDEQLSQEE